MFKYYCPTCKQYFFHDKTMGAVKCPNQKCLKIFSPSLVVISPKVVVKKGKKNENTSGM